MDLEQIKDCIPHRDPFLWIDEVLDINDTTIHATKYLDTDLDLFSGHYPEFPILPGVIQCEMGFQAAALLIAQQIPMENDKVPVVTRLNDVKFRQMVRPGDTVNIHAEITERLQDTFFLSGKTVVDGKVTCRFAFAATTTELPGENSDS